MARSRRESHHNDGITDQKSLQPISATKSANCRYSPPAGTLENHSASNLDRAFLTCFQFIDVSERQAQTSHGLIRSPVGEVR
jgi:hypothetical protein